MSTAYTPWSTQLQDRTDNWLILSTGELLSQLAPAVLARAILLGGEPVYEVIEQQSLVHGRTTQPPGRIGVYTIQEVLGGDDPIASDACAWGHAVVGDQDHQLWNTTTTDPDEHGTPHCRLSFPGAAEPSGVRTGAHRLLHYSSGGLLISATMKAEDYMGAAALWFGASHPYLTPWGVFTIDDIDLIAAGLPADYTGSVTVQFEEDDIELTKVEVAGDRDDRAAVEDSVQFTFNDAIFPVILGGEWNDRWTKGQLASADPTGRPYFDFGYVGGDPFWVEYPGIASWADCADPAVDVIPDATVGSSITDAAFVGDNLNATGVIAVRETLRSPRFRLVYEVAPDPVRKLHRRDGTGWVSASRPALGIPPERIVGYDR